MQKLPTSETENEEIIIIGDLNNVLKHFVKESLILWHDPNIDSHENSNLLQEFKAISDIKTFNDWQQAAKYLKDTETPFCQVITSGRNGECLVKEISQLKNVYSIHVFCGNVDYHKTWASQYSKVVSVENDFNQLKTNLENKIVSWQRQESSLRINLPSYAPIFDDVHKSENTYLHFYLKGFVRFQNRNQAKKDLLRLSKALYDKNHYIRDFEKNYNEYNMKQILEWYTKECFLYKITNNCLRIATSDSIQYCRLVLRDLQQAIKEKFQQESKNFSGLLYRGAYISNQEWNNLVLNIGKDIEMYGFLSTSKNKRVALGFICDETDKKGMITIIVPAAPEKGEQGFAEIKEYSIHQDEDEVLFNVMSRFTILEAKMEEFEEGNKCRHLVLLYGALEMRKFSLKNPTIKIKTQDLKRCYVCGIEISILYSPLVLVNLIRCDEYSCFNCLQEYQTENKEALICIPPSMITKSMNLEIRGFVMKTNNTLNIPFYRSRCHRCKNKNLKSCSTCTNCEGKKQYCERCYYLNDCFKERHLIILETHPFSFWSERINQRELVYLNYQTELESQESHFFHQALIFSKAHNYKGTIDYYNKFLEKHANKTDSMTASSYLGLGNAYSSLRENQKAIQYYSKALEIQKTILGDQHPDTAFSYNNLGNVYFSLEEYQKAIQSHSKALEIQKTFLGDQHPDAASSYLGLGNAYSSLGEYQKAIQYHSKALEIKKTVFGDHHPSIASSDGNLGNAFYSLGEYQKAILFYSKALEIQKTALGDQHPDTALSYENLGNTYCNLTEYQKAILFYSKALEIRKTVLGDQHPDTASSYNSLGNAYCNLIEYQKAIQYYSKALEIQKTVLGDQHPHTASSYGNLGNAFYSLGEYQKAIQFYSQALEIKRKILGDQHQSTASSYNKIANAYYSLGEYQKAIQFYSKALEIRIAVLGNQHPITCLTAKSLDKTRVSILSDTKSAS